MDMEECDAGGQNAKKKVRNLFSYGIRFPFHKKPGEMNNAIK